MWEINTAMISFPTQIHAYDWNLILKFSNKYHTIEL